MSDDKTDRVYLAGQGHSGGGYASIEVFHDMADATEYAESLFETDDREWSKEPNIRMDTDSGSLYAEETTLFYGFHREWKGFVKAKEVK